MQEKAKSFFSQIQVKRKSYMMVQNLSLNQTKLIMLFRWCKLEHWHGRWSRCFWRDKLAEVFFTLLIDYQGETNSISADK